MDQTTAEFWENHSVRFLQMVVGTDKRGSIDNADGYGNAGRECGDSLEIFLNVEDDTIRSAYFETDGCFYTVACGNAVVHLVEDRTVEEALALTTSDIVEYLETLPEAEIHCAEMAIRSLRLALADLRENDRRPWKKLYRKR